MPEKKRKYKRYWTKERCIEALEEFVRKAGRCPRTSETTAENGLPAPQTFQDAVGCSFRQYCLKQGHAVAGSKWSHETCKEAVDKFIKENNRLPNLFFEARPSFGLLSTPI